VRTRIFFKSVSILIRLCAVKFAAQMVFMFVFYIFLPSGWLHKSNTGFDKRVEKDDKPVSTILFACVR
jgi:hypothetical protein